MLSLCALHYQIFRLGSSRLVTRNDTRMRTARKRNANRHAGSIAPYACTQVRASRGDEFPTRRAHAKKADSKIRGYRETVLPTDRVEERKLHYNYYHL